MLYDELMLSEDLMPELITPLIILDIPLEVGSSILSCLRLVAVRQKGSDGSIVGAKVYSSFSFVSKSE